MIYSDKSLVLLTTGDPMWFGAGCQPCRASGSRGVRDCAGGIWLAAGGGPSWLAVGGVSDGVSVHGRPAGHLHSALYPRARLLVIAQDGSSPAILAKALCDWGYGAAQIHVMAHLGGPEEVCFSGTAAGWQHDQRARFSHYWHRLRD